MPTSVFAVLFNPNLLETTDGHRHDQIQDEVHDEVHGEVSNEVSGKVNEDIYDEVYDTTLTPQMTQDIDSTGDVLIAVGQRKFRVSSKLIASVSEPLSKLLDPEFWSGVGNKTTEPGPWWQWTAEEPFVVELPETDDCAVWILLHVLHDNFQDPDHENRTLFSRTFVPHYGMCLKLSSLAAKYQCLHIL